MLRLKYIFRSVLLVTAFSIARAALAQWVFQERHSNADGATLRGLAASAELLVAVGDRGRILRSADGAAWSVVQSGISAALRAVVYAGGKFVAVGDRGWIASSSNGLAWTAIESGTAVSLNAIAFGGENYVAVGDNGTILTSTDGFVWTPRNSGVTASLRGVGWMTQSAAFITAGDSGTLLDSVDGGNWSARTTGTNDDFLTVAAGHVFFYVTGRGGVYSGTSSLFGRENGTGRGTFRAVAMQPQSGPIALAVGDGGTAAVNRGDPWLRVVSGTSITLNAATFARDTFFAVGEREGIFQGIAETTNLNSSLSTRVRNLSNRALAGADSETLIAGFVIEGSGSKRLLIRAAGPALLNFGVSQVVSEPTLTVFDSNGRTIGRNTGWSTGDTEQLRAVTRRTGAFRFPENSADSALVLTLPAGAYTAHVSGPRAGVALVELYDTEYWPEIATSRLMNISSRCLVRTGDASAITGMVLPRGRKLLIRASGPSLSRLGVAGVLRNPKLELVTVANSINFIGGGVSTMPPVMIATNDDWNDQLPDRAASAGSVDEIRDVAQRCGAFPLAEGSTDAAMLITLNGSSTTNMTVHVSGSDGSSGIALIEVYDVEGL